MHIIVLTQYCGFQIVHNTSVILYSQQVDVLPSNNQVLLFNVLLRVFNDITSESHEQRLITKEHIAMHTNLLN